jgi:hypothetical protein
MLLAAQKRTTPPARSPILCVSGRGPEMPWRRCEVTVGPLQGLCGLSGSMRVWQQGSVSDTVAWNGLRNGLGNSSSTYSGIWCFFRGYQVLLTGLSNDQNDTAKPCGTVGTPERTNPCFASFLCPKLKRR